MNDFNPQRFVLQRQRPKQVNEVRKLPHHKRGEQFLKGPIPWVWLTKAAIQPGKALHVAIALWHLSAMKKTRMISLPNKILASCGVNRFAKSRALNALKNAGLISIEQHQGRSPVIILRDIDEKDDADGSGTNQNRSDNHNLSQGQNEL